eukprot:TRINITY_DN12487_c0_g1_i2.p1 TRINITY_DN12487_c0_g1~~TRINITY_DN12487_c0_g1_i2.p1  ORF type:complete len:108 (+),score=12.07 TRINITY_DN12487_c0_g1_i2:699-1022(+)
MTRCGTDVKETDAEEFLGGKPLYGLALDYQKCFDRVPQELTFELVEKGVCPKILGSLGFVYSNLDRRLKLPLGVGGPFKVSNGILQGCPLSVVMINALVGIMHAKDT